MKKFIKIIFATMLTFLITLPVNAQEDLTVEKGQYLQVGSAEENVTVNIHNEQDKPIWKNVEVENIDGVANVLIPLNNPLKTIYVHIVKGDEESVLKVHLTEPHEHQGRYVGAVRPTDTEAGNKAYFYCDCGKYFEDKACTIEITEDINTWKYLAPIPKEEWGEGNPVPYVEEIDGKNIIDPTKPNPSWEQEKVEEYYKNEEIETQKELEERKEKSETEVETTEPEETIKPMTLSVEPVEVKEEPTFWEKVKMFFINLFK